MTNLSARTILLSGLLLATAGAPLDA